MRCGNVRVRDILEAHGSICGVQFVTSWHIEGCDGWVSRTASTGTRDGHLVCNSWDEWFALVGESKPYFERYEKALRRYLKRRGESELFGRPHKQGFYRSNSVIAARAVGGIIRAGFIGLALGLLVGFLLSARTGEPNPVLIVGGAVVGVVWLVCFWMIPGIVRELANRRRLAAAEEALLPYVSLIPQQDRNATCAGWFEELHDAYGWRDFDGAERQIEKQKESMGRGYVNVRALVDVPFDASGFTNMRRPAGAHDESDPNLPSDIKGHTHAGSADWRGDLDALIGLSQVKSQVRRLENRVRVHGGSGAAVIGGNNMVLMGPAGTGKTSVARILTGMLAEAGIIAENRIVEIDGGYLKDGRVGMTDKRTAAVCKWAEGGVLFIDEAYLLFDEGSTAGREATGVLLKYMEDHTQDLVVMLAGYTDDMERLIASNEGFRSRVRHTLRFEPYTAIELAEICERVFLVPRGIHVERGVRDILAAYFDAASKSPGFGGAREARNAADALIDVQSDRVAASGGDRALVTVADARAWEAARARELAAVGHDFVATSGIDDKIVSAAELEQRTRIVERGADALLARLVGQDGAKAELTAWKARSEMLGHASGSANVALLGPAGVGKTTFAEVVTRMLFEAGRIREPRMLDVTGDWFRANYVGQTGTRTEAAIQWSRGGVLFIDEAYLMVDAGNSDFGTQALGTLVNDMEKMDDLVVIVAGYTEQMQAFFAQNPGVTSRIATTIELAPYTVRELMLILQRMARAEKFKLAPDVYRTLQPGVEAHMGEVDFGQGRAMRNVLQHMVSSHAARWSKDRSLDRHLLDAEDARMAMTRMGW